MHMSVLIRIAVISLAVLASSAAFAAETFPNRPIRMIVPYSPGGNVDISARTIGPGLTHLLGQQIVVDNRPGAGGIVGA
jgi:tripartite-type tricarboxylate transporter receptor subunit TctC